MKKNSNYSLIISIVILLGIGLALVKFAFNKDKNEQVIITKVKTVSMGSLHDRNDDGSLQRKPASVTATKILSSESGTSGGVEIDGDEGEDSREYQDQVDDEEYHSEEQGKESVDEKLIKSEALADSLEDEKVYLRDQADDQDSTSFVPPINQSKDVDLELPSSPTQDGKSDDGFDPLDPSKPINHNLPPVDESFLIFSNYASGTYGSSLNLELYSSRSSSTLYYCVGKWFGTTCSCQVSLQSSQYFSSITIGELDGLYCVDYFALDDQQNRSKSETLIFNIDKTNLSNPTFANQKKSHYVQSSTWIKIEDSSSNQLITTGDKSVYNCADDSLQNAPQVLTLENSMLNPSKLDRTIKKNHVYDLAAGGTCASMTVVVKDFEVYSFTSSPTETSSELTGGINPYQSGLSEVDETSLISGFSNIVGSY